MKKMTKLMVILWLIAAVVICCLVLGKKDTPLPKVGVVSRPVQIQQQATPALDIQLAIVDENIEEWCEELQVVDSIVYIPEEIAVESEENLQEEGNNDEYEEVEEEFIEEYIEYDEPILMAIDNEEEFYNNAGTLFYDGGVEYDSGLQEDAISYTTEDEIEIVEVEETIEEKEEELEEIEGLEIIEYQQEKEEEIDGGGAAVITTNGTLGSQIVDYARQWIGVTPYVSWYNRMNNGYISNSLESGTDCSGFVSLIYDTFGIQTSAASDDYQYMSNISYDELELGDIVVYRNGGHVGIYAGEDTIIHCSNEDVGTIESDMWYSEPTGYVHIYDDYYEQDYNY